MAVNTMSSNGGYSAKSYALFPVEDSNCLPSIISTLPDTNDAELRRFLTARLSRGAVFPGNGHITTIDLGIEPANCYYCLLNPQNVTASAEQYVVCFITESDRGLDSFRSQLDQHSARIENVLRELVDDSVSSSVKPLLESWYHECLQYVCRCVKRLGKDIKYVMYNAVANGQINVESDDKELETDLEKFHAGCTLAPLLNNQADSSSDTSGSGSLLLDLEAEPVLRTKRNVEILNITMKNGELTFSDKECTSFCEDWAQHVLEKYAYSLADTGDVNPYDLKQVNENYKLKTIQDMNSLKRLVKQAELDYYGLFRAYVFLRKTGNYPILLMHAINEEQSTDTLSILNLMKQRIENEKQD